MAASRKAGLTGKVGFGWKVAYLGNAGSAREGAPCRRKWDVLGEGGFRSERELFLRKRPRSGRWLSPRRRDMLGRAGSARESESYSGTRVPFGNVGCAERRVRDGNVRCA